MKRFLPIFLTIFLAAITGISGTAYAWSLFPKKVNPIERNITDLMIQHQNYLDRLFKEMNVSFAREINSFDRTFFTEVGFLNDVQAVNFFNNVESSLEKGIIPRSNGVMSISYSKYVNINGAVTGVNYSYNSDGKVVTLVKSTDTNGSLDKAVYRYDIKGRKLDVKEFKGRNLVDENIQKLI